MEYPRVRLSRFKLVGQNIPLQSFVPGPREDRQPRFCICTPKGDCKVVESFWTGRKTAATDIPTQPAFSGRPCTGHLPQDGLVLTERLHELLGIAVLLLRLPPHIRLATWGCGDRMQPMPPTVAASRPWYQRPSDTTMRPNLLWTSLLWSSLLWSSLLWPRLLGDQHEAVGGGRARAQGAQQLEPSK